MPYTGELLIIIACLVWAGWRYGVLDIRIEDDEERGNHER